MSQDFAAAIEASDLSPQDALRIAAKAMVAAHKKYGRIPRDMEIRQLQIGDFTDLPSIIERLEAVAEAQGTYTTTKAKPPDHRRTARTGPVALVSDRPA